MEIVYKRYDRLPSENANSSVAERNGSVPSLLDIPPSGGVNPLRASLPTAAYLRVSTEDQAKEGFSLDAQQARIQSYCHAKGYWLVGEFVDDGFSGRSTNRPGFQRLLAAVRDGVLVDGHHVRIASVVVAKFDRLNRNLYEFLATQQEMQNHNVHFASVDETIDTTGPFGRFFIQIIGAFAELESGIIGERVRHGMRQKAVRGGFNGMSAPFGYEINNGTLVVNEREAATIRQVDRWKRRGKSLSWIADRLDRLRIPTKRGGRWSARQVFRIIHSPLIRGDLKWGDVVAKGHHEPILRGRRERDG